VLEGTGRNGVMGEYYLSVLEASESDYPVPVRLVATYGSDVPESAPAVPVLTGDEYRADSVRLATVQLVSPSGIGSGCIVSGDGKILTNHHVVVDDGGVELPELIVAVAPAAFDVPVETFSAEVIRTSPKDDLALLRITGDRWGRPLPAGVSFSVLETGRSAFDGARRSAVSDGFSLDGIGIIPLLFHFDPGYPLGRRTYVRRPDL
jgi:hypothetical protein